MHIPLVNAKNRLIRLNVIVQLKNHKTDTRCPPGSCNKVGCTLNSIVRFSSTHTVTKYRPFPYYYGHVCVCVYVCDAIKYTWVGSTKPTYTFGLYSNLVSPKSKSLFVQTTNEQKTFNVFRQLHKSVLLSNAIKRANIHTIFC